MRALYSPPPLLGIPFMRLPPREVEFLEWVEEYGRPKMARIRVSTDPRSILGIIARRDGLPLPPPQERLVEAEFVSLLQ